MDRSGRQLAAAAMLNAALCVAEGAAGFRAESLSLVMDGIHNLSDELALVLLWLAFALPRGVSGKLCTSASSLNAIGIASVSGLLLWQAINRMQSPVPVQGIVPIVVGLGAATGNWGVARLLRGAGLEHPAIRLAYLHNLGDVFLSLAPVLAGLLMSATGRVLFEPLIAGLVALWLLGGALRQILPARPPRFTHPQRVPSP